MKLIVAEKNEALMDTPQGLKKMYTIKLGMKAEGATTAFVQINTTEETEAGKYVVGKELTVQIGCQGPMILVPKRMA